MKKLSEKESELLNLFRKMGTLNRNELLAIARNWVAITPKGLIDQAQDNLTKKHKTGVVAKTL